MANQLKRAGWTVGEAFGNTRTVSAQLETSNGQPIKERRALRVALSYTPEVANEIAASDGEITNVTAGKRAGEVYQFNENGVLTFDVVVHNETLHNVYALIYRPDGLVLASPVLTFGSLAPTISSVDSPAASTIRLRGDGLAAIHGIQYASNDDNPSLKYSPIDLFGGNRTEGAIGPVWTANELTVVFPSTEGRHLDLVRLYGADNLPLEWHDINLTIV